MGKASPRHFPPPLKGIEWRDIFQDAEGEAITAECMINLETSHASCSFLGFYDSCSSFSSTLKNLNLNSMQILYYAAASSRPRITHVFELVLEGEAGPW